MKKTIFIAVALSLLLCANAFPDEYLRTSTGQKVVISYLIGEYPSGQTMGTRIHIRNNDPQLPIRVVWAIFADTAGNAVHFNCDEQGNTVDDYINLIDPNGVGSDIYLTSYASVSINVTANMLANCSTWIYPFLNADYLEGGRPFIEITWGATESVVPPEIFAFFRSIYGGLKGQDKYRIRYDFERWEGKVVKELGPIAPP